MHGVLFTVALYMNTVDCTSYIHVGVIEYIFWSINVVLQDCTSLQVLHCCALLFLEDIYNYNYIGAVSCMSFLSVIVIITMTPLS